MEETLVKETSAKNLVKPRLGFAGVGWIGKNRMEAIVNEYCAQVSAICEKDESTLTEVCNELGDVRSTASFDALLEEDLDGIVIATPSALHYEQSLQALNKGMAVFCQKPLARNSAQTTEVVRAAREADKLLGVDFSYRDTEAVKALKKVIDSGEIGKVYGAELVFHNAYGPGKKWYYDPGLSGGGCLMDLGIHLVDLVHHLFPGTSLQNCKSSIYHEGKPVNSSTKTAEDYVSAQLDFSNDLSAQLACSWNLSAGKDAVIKAIFYGTEGGVSFRNIGGSFYDFETLLFKGTDQQVLVSPPDNWSGRTAAQWAKNLQTDSSFTKQAEEFVTVAQTMDAIYTS